MTRLSDSALRAQQIAAERGRVSSLSVAQELQLSRNRALQILRELVRVGVLDVHNAGDGTYEYTPR